MKRMALPLLLLCALALAAHPPKSLDLSYDAEKAELSVKILHRVNDPQRHFVERIEVTLGEELLAEKTFERQENAEGQEAVFLLGDRPLARGEEVVVTATCNISGKRSARLKRD